MKEVNSKPRAGRGSPLGVSKLASSAKFAALAGLSILGLAAGSASAQVITPPPAPADITVFPVRDFLGIAGYLPDADVLVQVRRGNSVVGTARGRTQEVDPVLQQVGGELEVNHPGGICWKDVTPDIVGYDVVQVTYDNTEHNRTKGGVPIGSGYATRTAGISAQAAYVDANNNVIVKGKALQGITAVPLARLEIRIRNKDFMDGPFPSRIGKQDILVTSAGGRIDDDNGDPVPGTSATLSYDAPTAACRVGCFTAVFRGLNETERNLALAGQTRVMSWQAANAAGDRLGLTIYEVGEAGGPGMGGCPPGPNGAVAPKPPTYPVPYNPLNLQDAANPVDFAALAEVVAFPMRDFMGVEGLPANSRQDLQIVLRRQDPNNPNNPNGVIVGSARGLSSTILVDDETGEQMDVLEVNHPGGICWSGQTPRFQANDKLDVFKVVNGAFAGGQTQTVIGVTISEPPFVNGQNQLIVRGTMPEGFDMSQMEQRIVQPLFRQGNGSRIQRRDIRADVFGGVILGVNGATGFLVPTSPTTWQATYIGLNATELKLAMAGGFRIMAWQALGPVVGGEAARLGMTIWEYGEEGGPGMGGCPTSGGLTIPIPLP
jgi:hypothetical protein